MDTVTKNKATGDTFEDLFHRQAKRNGLLVIKNYLTCRFIYGGNVKVVKGELDFKLISQKGDVGYFDCKTYQEDFFVHSVFEKEQIDRAVLYNHYCVPSGFVVWFRQINRVVFYSGYAIARKGPGSRFLPEDGQSLGSYENFDLKPLLKRKMGKWVKLI